MNKLLCSCKNGVCRDTHSISIRELLDNNKNMKIMIIRHGDPDYSIDSLTEKGWREAELLSQRLSALNLCIGKLLLKGFTKDFLSFLSYFVFWKFSL